MNSRRNIVLMYAIALLQGMVFYAPIASLYRQAAGLTLGQIAIIEGISYLMCFAMELPWGILADRFGYRRTMIICCGFYFLSKIIFWQADSFAAFLAERFALSVALAGFSGVDESILYLSAPPEECQSVFGRYNACNTAGLLLASAVYMLFIGERYRLAALITMIAYALAALAALGLKEVRPAQERALPSLRSFTRLLRQTLQNRPLIIFISAFTLFREAGQMVTVWLNQNQYLRCGMTSAGMGLAHIAVTLGMLSSARSGNITQRLGIKRFAVLALCASAAGCVALMFTRSPWLSVFCVAAVAASGALLAPLASAICNRQIAAQDRATQLSIFALLQHCVAAGADTLYGRAADVSLNAAFLLCALACAAAWAGICILLRHVHE